MTDQDERTIYEWAYPELNGKAWTLLREEWSDDGRMMPQLQVEGQLGGTYTSSLDMNFAFDVCIPRLNADSVSVTFTNCDDAGRWHLIDWECGDKVDMGDYEAANFYDALLAYIEGGL